MKNLFPKLANVIVNLYRKIEGLCTHALKEYRNDRGFPKLQVWGALASITALIFYCYPYAKIFIDNLVGTGQETTTETSESDPPTPLETDQQLLKCETPWQVYKRSRPKVPAVSDPFEALYKGKWIPPDCWVLQVAESANQPARDVWSMELVAPMSGATVQARSKEDLAHWRGGDCAEVTGKLVSASPPGRFVVEDATLDSCRG